MIIKKGSIMRIEGEEYEVLSLLEEVDSYDAEKKEFVGEHTEITLHKNGSESITGTHYLKMYYDSERRPILHNNHDNTNKEIERNDIEVIE